MRFGPWVYGSGLFVIVMGLVFGVLVPTEFMGLREAFFARFLVVAPTVVFGLILVALGRIVQLLEIVSKNTQNLKRRRSGFSPDARAQFEQVSYNTRGLSSAQVMNDPVGDAVVAVNSNSQLSHDVLRHLDDVAQQPQFSQSDYPSEYNSDEGEDAALPLLPPDDDAAEDQLGLPIREGVIAGRVYRLFEDGTLEVDTDESTIRFASIDEFRNFIFDQPYPEPTPPQDPDRSSVHDDVESGLSVDDSVMSGGGGETATFDHKLVGRADHNLEVDLEAQIEERLQGISQGKAPSELRGRQDPDYPVQKSPQSGVGAKDGQSGYQSSSGYDTTREKADTLKSLGDRPSFVAKPLTKLDLKSSASSNTLVRDAG